MEEIKNKGSKGRRGEGSAKEAPTGGGGAHGFHQTRCSLPRVEVEQAEKRRERGGEGNGGTRELGRGGGARLGGSGDLNLGFVRSLML